MNGFTLVALIAVAIVAWVAYRIGSARARTERRADSASLAPVPAPVPAPTPAAQARENAVEPAPLVDDASADRIRDELARLVRSYAVEASRLRDALAEARAEIERYRRIVVDIENNTPPPLLDGPGTPDDLKLIVGIGPVLERMLHQLGIGTYRQIARWSERDIDEIDARLPEFPGRIRRDAWVMQARELHHSKYGERP